MALTLRSPAAGDLILLNDLAKALLGCLGKDSSQPGILEPKDMAAAVQTLKALPDTLEAASEGGEGDDEGAPANQADVPFADAKVPLRHRAAPLVRMIEFAMAENQPIVWGV
jgi:Domain of unknown function (DUF1840)